MRKWVYKPFIPIKKRQSLTVSTKSTPIYPHKKTSITNRQHKKYSYLLRNLNITHPDQVWVADITYSEAYIMDLCT